MYRTETDVGTSYHINPLIAEGIEFSNWKLYEKITISLLCWFSDYYVIC